MNEVVSRHHLELLLFGWMRMFRFRFIAVRLSNAHASMSDAVFCRFKSKKDWIFKAQGRRRQWAWLVLRLERLAPGHSPASISRQRHMSRLPEDDVRSVRTKTAEMTRRRAPRR